MDIRQRVLAWSLSEPSWRRDLLRRVATSEATDTDCAEVLELLLKEKGLSDVAPAARPLELEHLPEDVPQSPEVIAEVGRCSNVNAIESADPLTFEPTGITLVYGNNAAGKSSYARVLKRIARAAHREEVLPNVYSSGPAKEPQAVVEVEVDGARSPHIVALTGSQLVLPSTTVFDGRCAAAYLSSRRKIEFIPIPLLIFARTVSAQKKIKTLVEARIGALRQSRPDLEAFPQGTEVRMLLESSSSSVSAERIADLAVVSEEEKQNLAQLKLEVAQAQAGTASATITRLTTLASQIDQIAGHIDRIESALSDEQAREVDAARQALTTARKAVDLARNGAFAGEPLEQSGNGEWITMWNAARAFVVNSCGHPFPPTDDADVCPFCQQPLAADARDRLQRFEEFVAGTVEDEARNAEEALQRAIERCSPREFNLIPDSLITSIEAESSELASALSAWLAQARLRREALVEGGRDVPALGGSPASVFRAKAEETRATIKSLEQTIADPSEVSRREHAINEMAARVALNDRVDEMVAWRRNASAIAKLTTIADSDLATGRVSTAFGQLAQEVVTNELRDAVKRELSALRFDYLPIDLDYRTEQGEPTAQMALGGASTSKPLGEVLSESEQRACALAFFLAEALISESEGPVILDDPASSFDAERIAHISKRIVELAKKRKQVIIFTHHLAFAWTLREIAGQEDVAFAPRLIDAVAGRSGVVRNQKVWPGEGIKARIKALRNELQQIEALDRANDVDAYEGRARKFAADVRVAWEHAVEDQLFEGVVKRFQRDVKTQHIRQIIVTPALTQAVFDGMEETNPFHHSETMETPVPTPTVAELHSFFSHLEGFADLVKAERVGAAQSASVSPVAAAAQQPSGAA